MKLIIFMAIVAGILTKMALASSPYARESARRAHQELLGMAFVEALKSGKTSEEELLKAMGLTASLEDEPKRLMAAQFAQDYLIEHGNLKELRALRAVFNFGENYYLRYLGIYSSVRHCSTSVLNLYLSDVTGLPQDLLEIADGQIAFYRLKKDEKRQARCEQSLKTLEKAFERFEKEREEKVKTYKAISSKISIKDDDLAEKTKSGKVVLLVSSEHCGPCLTLMPAMPEIMKRFKNCIQFFYYDQDANKGLSVRGIPFRFYYKDGKEVGNAAGASMIESENYAQLSREIELNLLTKEELEACVQKEK